MSNLEKAVKKYDDAVDEFYDNGYPSAAERIAIRNFELDIIEESRNAVKELQALKIILEKGLPLFEMDMIKQSNNYTEYKIKFSWCNPKNVSIQKSENEFYILKELFKQ